MAARTHRRRRLIAWFSWVGAAALLLGSGWSFRPGDENALSSATETADRESAARDFDEILVDLDDEMDAREIAAIEEEFGIDLRLVSAESRDEQFYRARVAPTRQREILAGLARTQGVELAEPDATFQLAPTSSFRAAAHDIDWQGFPNDPRFPQQWHMDQIQMRDAWKLADGEGVVVAVLDTGVAYEAHGRFHRVEDLDGVEIVKPYDFVDNDRHANDDHGHGTHVAGTIAQATHNGVGVAGVARKVKIMPLKVLSGSGSGSVGGIADAIRYAADEGADVINMSLGGPFPSRALKKAVKYAHDQGVVVICAAGNDGRSRVGYPAGFPGAIAVSATQFDETVTFYSNYGKNIDIAAPGGNTRVDQNEDGLPDGVLQNTIVVGDPTKSDYFGFMGTSMASPHAAGVAALVVGEGVNDPGAVEEILKDTARAPSQGRLDRAKYGAGIIDAEAAVRRARGTTGALQFGLGLLLAVGLSSSLRRRDAVRLSMSGTVSGLLIGSAGLFVLPLAFSGVSSWPVLEMLSRGLPSWDLALFGPAGHGNPIFFSALPVVAIFALGFGWRKSASLLAGLAVGVAAHLLFHAITGVSDIRWLPAALAPAWLVINAGICLWLARTAMRPSRA